MRPHDLISTARLLLRANRNRPSQSNLKRAISSAYYAMFHCMARNCANTLIGGTGAEKSRHAWTEVYRAINHNAAFNACNDRAIITRFPQEIQDFSNTFVQMQTNRHEADYNPDSHFTKTEVEILIDMSELAISSFMQASQKDRRAFASWILFRNKKR